MTDRVRFAGFFSQTRHSYIEKDRDILIEPVSFHICTQNTSLKGFNFFFVVVVVEASLS